MAGIHFSFDNFKQLMDLNIGISDRLDQNRAESFTLLYCNFEGIAEDIVDASLLEILRTSDSIVNHQHNYFFVLPYTDKYGAEIVKKMFDEFFAKHLDSFYSPTLWMVKQVRRFLDLCKIVSVPF
jgi:hypothetical protein